MPVLCPASFHGPSAETSLRSLPSGSAAYNVLRKALYKEGTTWDQALARIPPLVAEAVKTRFVWWSSELVRVWEATDGSTKALWRSRDGLTFESVLMRHRGRTTLCVSSQVGCALGCVFCATGRLGLHRDLTPGEILDQAAWAAAILRSEGLLLRNVVFMGMGEPLLALDGYAPATGHQLLLECVMLSGVIDSNRECAELTALLKGRDAHVNLIPATGTGWGRASDPETLDRFQKTLVEAGIPATVRHSAGETMAAACGQLVGNDPLENNSGRADSTVDAKRN